MLCYFPLYNKVNQIIWFLNISINIVNYIDFFKFLFYIGAWLINNAVLVSGIQPSDSVIHIDESILFQLFSPFRLLQNIEQHFLCYTLGPCWLSILNTVVCTFV